MFHVVFHMVFPMVFLRVFHVVFHVVPSSVGAVGHRGGCRVDKSWRQVCLADGECLAVRRPPLSPLFVHFCRLRAFLVFRFRCSRVSAAMMSNADETTFSEGMIYHCITEPTRRALLFVILHYFSKGDYPVVARTGWVGVPASGRSGCAFLS